MKIKERLLECKVKLGIKSDYALAKVLGINRGTLSGYMKGGRLPDAFTAVRIGEILNVHPLILLAEFEAENAKTEERRGFWLNFGRRIKSGALGMLALTFTAFWWPEAKTGTTALDTHNVYYVKRYLTTGGWPSCCLSSRLTSCQRACAMTPSQLDLFGEVPVTWCEVYAWCGQLRISQTPWRLDWYIHNWNVIDKVRRAKLAGTF